MTDVLLPPDPTRDGWYWLLAPVGEDRAARWSARGRYWRTVDFAVLSAKNAADLGYALASRHPIPTAAQLDALHSLPDVMVVEAHKIEDAVGVEELMHEFSCAKKHAAMLRAALKGDAP